MVEDIQQTPEETTEEKRARMNNNLKPAQAGEVRNPKGRGKGVPNLSTTIRKWMNAKEVLPPGENPPPFLKKGARLSQMDIMILAQIKKARDGDVTSFNALMDRLEGKPVQKSVLANDPTDPLPAPRQVIILPNGQEISFE